MGPLGGVVSVSPHLGSLTNTFSIYIILLGRHQELPKHAGNPQSQTAVLHLITTQFGRWRCYEPRGDGESWGGEVSGLSDARPPPTRPGPGKEARELQAGCFSTLSSGSTAPGGGPKCGPVWDSGLRSAPGNWDGYLPSRRAAVSPQSGTGC